MPASGSPLAQYRAEILAASVKLLGAYGITADFPATHDPADIVLDTLERIDTSVGDAKGDYE